MKKIFLSLCLCCTITIMAQTYSVKGIVLDQTNKESVVSATVQLLHLPDSTFAGGTLTDTEGSFSIPNIKKAQYVIKVSSIGYITYAKKVDFTTSGKKDMDLGNIFLSTDEHVLGEVEVTANASKMQASGDSLIYNAAAYKVPEGSTLEALVRQLPGAEVDDDGNITINGRSVEKILIDGKEFFLNDKSIAMKNIPTDIIDRIKTYERKSDLARITGIDDGEEEMVLDLSIKKDKQNGWFGNLHAGLGTKDRYNERGMVNHFNSQMQVSAFGNSRNTPNRWGGNNGLRTNTDAGTNFTSTTEKLDAVANIRYHYDGNNIQNNSFSQNFVAARGAFNKSVSTNLSHNSSLKSDVKLEWKPDTMTNILFRPTFAYTRNLGYKSNVSGSYDEDPTTVSAEDLVEYTVNTNTSNNQTYTRNVSGGGVLQFNRKLGNKGRNITLRLSGNYAEGQSKQISAADITYNTLNETTINNRYYDAPSKNYDYSAQITYNEPIFTGTFLQFSYRYEHRYNMNDRKAYIYDSQAYQDLSQSINEYDFDVNAVLNFMEEANYLTTTSSKLCRYASYRSNNQRVGVQLKRIYNGMNLSVGVDAFPQHTILGYNYMGQAFPEVVRKVCNIAPKLQLKWDFDEHTSLRFHYNGRTTQPGMTSLLDITDDSDPLNIRKGNPNLNPTFSNNFNGDFHTYNPEKQLGMWSWLNGAVNRNSISDKTTYDTETGVRTTIPMNIDGNWNVGGGYGLHTGLGEKKYFFVGGMIGLNYKHNVGFYNNTSQTETDDVDLKSITKNLSVHTGCSTGYRRDGINIEFRGDLRWSHAVNNINQNANQNTYNFSYGPNINWTMPWGTEIATDMRMSSRRGYTSADMNTDELVWNASISHAFLQGKALTIKAEVFDILGQQTNVSRTVTAFLNSDTTNNSIYQYALFTAIYRFSIFGGKNVMGTDKERR